MALAVDQDHSPTICGSHLTTGPPGASARGGQTLRLNKKRSRRHSGGKTRLIQEALPSNHRVLYIAREPTLHALLACPRACSDGRAECGRQLPYGPFLTARLPYARHGLFVASRDAFSLGALARLYWNPTKAMNIPHLHERDAEQLFEAAPAISNCATWTLGSSVKGAGERPRESRADHLKCAGWRRENKARTEKRSFGQNAISACRFLMKIRGPQALPNRPPRTMACPTANWPGATPLIYQPCHS